MNEKKLRKLLGQRADAVLAPNMAASAPVFPLVARLPMPPSINSVYTSGHDNETGAPKRFKTPKGRKYHREVGALISQVLPSHDDSGKAILYRLTIAFHYPWYTLMGKLRKFDETNRIKVLEDAVAKAIQVDDSHFKAGPSGSATLRSIDTSRTGREQFVVISIEPL